MIKEIALIIISYLLGSVSFSILISGVFGVKDIREHGSGNAGATNVLRTVGKKAALFTFLCDVLKGVLPALAAYILKMPLNIMLLSSFAAILGHIFPIYFGFKGGKGVSTSFGAVITLSIISGYSWIVALLVAVWLIVVILTKYVSLGSVLVYGLYPVIITLFYKGESYVGYVIFAFVTAFLGIFMHRKNIARLIKGKESKIGQKSK